jgi:hypothetical protein
LSHKTLIIPELKHSICISTFIKKLTIEIPFEIEISTIGISGLVAAYHFLELQTADDDEARKMSTGQIQNPRL